MESRKAFYIVKELLETGTFTFYHMNREVLPETEA